MLKNMKLRRKLLIAFLTVTIISSIGSVYSIFQTKRLGQSAQMMDPSNLKLAIIIQGATLFVSFIVSVLIALYLSKEMSDRINEVTDAAKKMAEGDLNVTISDHSGDEIGQLGTALEETNAYLKAYITDLSGNLGKLAQGDLRVERTVEFKGDFLPLQDAMVRIVYSLNDMLTRLREVAEQVSGGSDQVSSSAQALAQGATEQASSIEELSSTITEISENVKLNADHAVTASQNVGNVTAELENSNRHMQEMLEAMGKISSSSNEIGKIIKTIEDIAFQTNILALNAAVEAARAGAAGKGFSVVADEVRNLASKSADAAKETTRLIQHSIEEVQNGMKIADNTAEALQKVVQETEEAADKVQKIAQISEQQASSINQITIGIDQISSVVQTNSATSEECAAASEELSGQAETMKELAAKFKLRN